MLKQRLPDVDEGDELQFNLSLEEESEKQLDDPDGEVEKLSPTF